MAISTRRGRDKLGGDIVDRSNREMLIEMVKEAGIQVYDHSIPTRLEDGRIVLEIGNKENTADTGERTERDELVDMINEHSKDSALKKSGDEKSDDTKSSHSKSGERGKSGEVVIAADSLVFAGRLLPHDALAKELAAISGGADNILSAGDCVKVDSIMHAVWGSFTAIRKIAA